jgi:hypothetical protein
MTDIYQKAYTSVYSSELGDILLAADEIGLTGLWFFGQSYFADTLPAEQIAQETPILAQAREWLDEYFSGKELYTDAASDRIAVSAGSVEAFAADSLWPDDDLWRDRKTAGKAAEPASYVCAGGRRCGGT